MNMSLRWQLLGMPSDAHDALPRTQKSSGPDHCTPVTARRRKDIGNRISWGTTQETAYYRSLNELYANELQDGARPDVWMNFRLMPPCRLNCRSMAFLAGDF